MKTMASHGEAGPTPDTSRTRSGGPFSRSSSQSSSRVPGEFDKEPGSSPIPKPRHSNLFGQAESSRNPHDSPGASSSGSQNNQLSAQGISDDIIRGVIATLRETCQLNKDLYESLNVKESQFNKELSDFNIRKETLDRVDHDARHFLPRKPTVRLNGKNFESWHTCILREAKVFQFDEIFEQRAPAGDLTPLQKEFWYRKREIMHARILNSLSPTILNDVADIKDTYDILQKLKTSYGKSIAEERLTTLIALMDLKVQDGDYHKFQSEFERLSAKLDKIGCTTEDFYHAVFIRGLGDFGKAFTKTQLDELYAKCRMKRESHGLSPMYAMKDNM